MKVIFYSEHCEHCKKMLLYLNKYNIASLFKLIDIDTNEVPKEIDIVPTIIDSELNQPLKGKQAFEYLVNIKYFNNPTNNIEYVKEIPNNPQIPVDELANKLNIINLEINHDINLEINSTNNKVNIDSNLNELFDSNDSTTFYETHKNKEVSKATVEMNNQRQIQDKKLSILLQMKRR
jgi:hypothetical protein